MFSAIQYGLFKINAVGNFNQVFFMQRQIKKEKNMCPGGNCQITGLSFRQDETDLRNLNYTITQGFLSIQRLEWMIASFATEFLTIKLETLRCTMKATFLRRPRLIYVSVIAVCRMWNERNESAVRQRTSVIIHMSSLLSANS